MTSSKSSCVVGMIGAALFLAVVIIPRMRNGDSNTSSATVLGTADASAHKVLWKFKSESGGFTSIALGPDGTVYAGANNGLYALSPDGNLKWKTPEAGLLYLSTGADGTVFIATSYGLGSGVASEGKVSWNAGVGMIGGSPTPLAPRLLTIGSGMPTASATISGIMEDRGTA